MVEEIDRKVTQEISGLFKVRLGMVSLLRVFISGVVVLILGGASLWACQLQFTGKAAKLFGSAPRGDFRNLDECNAFRNTRPYFERVNSRCVNCTRTSPNIYGGTGSFSQNIFAGLMQSFMQGFMQSMAAQPQRPSLQQQAMLKQQQEKRWAEYRARVRKQVKKLDEEYRRLAEEEFRKRKSRLLSDLKARYSATIGRKETSLAIRQFNCSAYWGVNAAKVYFDDNLSLDERKKLSRMYAQYSFNARSFSDAPLDECPPIEVEIPPPGTPQPVNFQRDFYHFIVQKTERLVPIISGLEEERDKAQQTIKAKKEEIKRIEAKLEAADESEKNEEDRKLLEEAYRVLNKAIEEEKKAKKGLSEARKKTIALERLRGLYDTPREAGKEEK